MPRKLYSFLIGIDKYPKPGDLSGCVNDVHKIVHYLTNLKNDFYEEVVAPVVLTDEEGNRKNIIEKLSSEVQRLTSEDSFLFYFSGHGVNEVSQDVFHDNYNGLIQTLYCYLASFDEVEDNKLANKELRYILNQSAKGAHILTVFDCCHSGDMTRSVQKGRKMKAASVTPFPERPYDGFVFANKTTPEDLKSKDFGQIFSDNNIITLSACLSSEKAWEYNGGGTFTNSLLKTLEANRDAISYADLLKQIELHVRSTTLEKQTPTISILGDRKYDQLTSWLRLNGDRLKTGKNYVQYNDKSGWMFSKGKIHGVKKGDVITVQTSKEKSTHLTIDVVNLVDASLDANDQDLAGLDRTKLYRVINETLHKIEPVLGIRNINSDPDMFLQVASILKSDDRIEYSEVLGHCDYTVSLFNGLIYLSFPEQRFQPLNRQFDTTKHKGQFNSIQSYFDIDLTTLSNWFHLKNLEIQDNFHEIPIKVEMNTGDGDFRDVTNGSFALIPQGRTTNDCLYAKYELKVTNESEDNIYVTLLALYHSRHEISADGFDGETVEILPGKSKVVKNFLQLDTYQEVYNWEAEKVYLKFLVNNTGEITQEISGLTQEGFVAPLTHLGDSRGGGSIDEIEDPVKNALYTTELTLKNNTLNRITGPLKSNLAWYMDNQKLAPFIEALYPETGKRKAVKKKSP